MLRYLFPFFCIVGLCSFVASESSERLTFDSIGLMPEIVVTAPRFEYEDDVWSGLMPEVVVTALRYAGDEVDSEIVMSERRPNARGIGSQPFSIDSKVIIILSVLGSMILFIGLYMLPHFLRKANVPTK